MQFKSAIQAAQLKSKLSNKINQRHNNLLPTYGTWKALKLFLSFSINHCIYIKAEDICIIKILQPVKHNSLKYGWWCFTGVVRCVRIHMQSLFSTCSEPKLQ